MCLFSIKQLQNYKTETTWAITENRSSTNDHRFSPYAFALCLSFQTLFVSAACPELASGSLVSRHEKPSIKNTRLLFKNFF